jgi:hypothetical protein
MQTGRWSRHVIKQTSGSVGGAHRELSTGTFRAWVARAILALALALGGLGVAAWASAGHGSSGHVHKSAQPAPMHPWMY